MPRTCSICGASPAPFGFGCPGTRRDKHQNKRGYIFVCSDFLCQAEALNRKEDVEAAV